MGDEKLFFANHKKLAVLYQRKGLGLRRCDFQMDSFIWHRFKALARFYNVSMCRLFVAFLKIFGTPKKNELTLKVQLYEKLQIFSKSTLRFYKIAGERYQLEPHPPMKPLQLLLRATIVDSAFVTRSAKHLTSC